jgi:hypothetical protein
MFLKSMDEWLLLAGAGNPNKSFKIIKPHIMKNCIYAVLNLSY